MNRCRRGLQKEKVNVNENPNTRTYKQIILENTLTFFNFFKILHCLFWLLFVRSYKNSMFIGNHSDQYSDRYYSGDQSKEDDYKLAILTESKTVVLREGKKMEYFHRETGSG